MHMPHDPTMRATQRRRLACEEQYYINPSPPPVSSEHRDAGGKPKRSSAHAKKARAHETCDNYWIMRVVGARFLLCFSRPRRRLSVSSTSFRQNAPKRLFLILGSQKRALCSFERRLHLDALKNLTPLKPSSLSVRARERHYLPAIRFATHSKTSSARSSLCASGDGSSTRPRSPIWSHVAPAGTFGFRLPLR